MPDEPSSAILTSGQRRIVAAALTLLAFLGSIALLVVTIIVVGRLMAFFSSVLWPLATAGVLALILRPLVAQMEAHLKLHRLSAVILLYIIVLLLATGILLALVPPVMIQVVDLVGYIPTLWARATAFVQTHYPQWMDFVDKLLANPGMRKAVDGLAAEGQALLGHALPSLRAAFGGAIDVFAFLTHVAIVPVYLFFFLLMRGRPAASLGRQLPFLRPDMRDDVIFLISEFIAILESFFRGQILIGLCMGVLFAIGFTLIGLKFGLVVGLALGVLNIIPYLGTIIGLAVTLPLAFFQAEGGWRLLGLVLLVKIAVQCVEGWFLTPKIMGHHTGLHPMAIVFAVFFWGTAFDGVLGMLLAVPLTAFFVTAWRLARRKYFTAPNA